jgi:hypothetical protein
MWFLRIFSNPLLAMPFIGAALYFSARYLVGGDRERRMALKEEKANRLATEREGSKWAALRGVPEVEGRSSHAGNDGTQDDWRLLQEPKRRRRYGEKIE